MHHIKFIIKKTESANTYTIFYLNRIYMLGENFNQQISLAEFCTHLSQKFVFYDCHY